MPGEGGAGGAEAAGGFGDGQAILLHSAVGRHGVLTWPVALPEPQILNLEIPSGWAIALVTALASPQLDQGYLRPPWSLVLLWRSWRRK